MIVPTPQSGSRTVSTQCHETIAALPSYNQAWCIDSLGTFCFRRLRYRVVKGRDRRDPRNLQEKEEFHVEYYWPPWIINRVWRIQAVKASSGWTFIPRTYNKVSKKSAVFHYAATNNIEGLKELFSMKLASPFDCYEFGSTPLMVNILCFVMWKAQKLIPSGRCSIW